MALTDVTVNQIVGGLDSMATQAFNSHGDDRPYNEIWGWNVPAMTRQDIADLIRSPVIELRQLVLSDVSPDDELRLNTFPLRIQNLQNQTLPYLSNGNASGAIPAISSLVTSLIAILSKYNRRPLELSQLEDKKLLPASQLKALKSIERGIQHLQSETSTLDSKVAVINGAHAAAEALPADLQVLNDARKRYEQAAHDLSKTQANADDVRERAFKILDQLKGHELEAKRLIEQASRAYSASTTVGLGASFAERAKNLTQSTWLLGGILIVTLSVGAAITYNRVEFVHRLMLAPNVDFNILWVNVTFTALSVSGPVWLAWLLTRQIGQRFRISEDYGYKSSVAKAYEGYRNEAAQIDDDLAKRLFAIALDILSEPPLRLIEKESPGSPMHDVKDRAANLANSARLFKSRRQTRPVEAPLPKTPEL